MAYCSACGQVRGPLTGASVTHAGSVSKAGGIFAKVVAWLTFGLGTVFVLLFGAGLGWWIPATMIAVLTLTVWGLLMWGGRALAKSGEKSATDTKTSAVFALAATRHGELRGTDLMQALNVSREEGDALLEQMSKQHPDHVILEVDEQGGLYYVFPRFRQRVASVQSATEDPLVQEFAELEAQEAAKIQRRSS